MATFRKVHTSFWSDEFVQELTPEQKYFYLYLLTNERTKQCGIYEITIRQMAFDTGYNTETIEKLIELFYKKGRIKYNYDTKELAMKNWNKYNSSDSPKVTSCINKELENVKDTLLIGYVYSIDTESQEEKEKEEEEEKDKEKEILFDSFWKVYDKKVGDKKKLFNKFKKLSNEEIEKIFAFLPQYLEATPDKQFRKNPETFLNNKSWNDEIIKSDSKFGNSSKNRMEELKSWTLR